MKPCCGELSLIRCVLAGWVYGSIGKGLLACVSTVSAGKLLSSQSSTLPYDVPPLEITLPMCLPAWPAFTSARYARPSAGASARAAARLAA